MNAPDRSIRSGDFVQVKTSGSAHCAAVIEPWQASDGAPWVKVDALQPLRFSGSFPVKSVKRCSGVDGLCVCAGETKGGAFWRDLQTAVNNGAVA